jgi:hypothetical protein
VWGETPFLTHPGAGKWVGRRYNAPAHRLFHGKQKRRREHSGPRLLPHMQPRHCAADTSRYADSRRTDLFPGVKGELQVRYRANGQCGRCGITFLVPGALSLVTCSISGSRRSSLLKDATPRLKRPITAAPIATLGIVACQSKPLTQMSRRYHPPIARTARRHKNNRVTVDGRCGAIPCIDVTA